PSYRTNSYVVGVADNEDIYSVDASSIPTPPADYERDVSSKYFVKNSNRTIGPKESRDFLFTLTAKEFLDLTGAKDLNHSGLKIRLEYAGPLDDPKTRPYYYQATKTPWLEDGYVHFKSI